MPPDLLKQAEIPLVETFKAFWAGVERLTRMLFRLLKAVTELLKVIHELPKVVAELLVALR